ncbi:MAG: hypothetical protein P9L92_03495 [Candidatus Electryonea clarkiae]|nr:hypothetical protein [Candidatus Electryonea clarkiae]MDP8287443.1 hypothetical protein [Candidatus Electryonea clarkiae]
MKKTLVKLALILSITGICIANAFASDVSLDAWLDSLEANQWRMKKGMRGVSCRTCMIMHNLDKKSEIKDSDTTWYLVEFDLEGDQVRHETDRDGNITKRGDKPDDGDTKEESMEISPFDPIKKEYRSDYQFRIDAANNENLPVITYEPKPGIKKGFYGKATIDTSMWIFTKFEGRPVPYPKKMIKEMNIELFFYHTEEGHVRLSKSITHLHAKILLLNIRVKSIENRFDYQRLE